MDVILSNVSKTIGHSKVIDDVSIAMESGLVYGFQGINGSGKTMLMKLVSGLIYPSDGTIQVNGKLLGKKFNFPDNMGLFIENPAFLDSYSGFQNLKLLASIQKKINDDEIAHAIQRVGLDFSDRKKYRKYSLGMKQRLGIACAIMEHPDLILLDEPTNSLDDKGIEMLQEIVKQEKARGALIIISCHDYDILTYLSDHIYKISAGKITNHFRKNSSSDFVEVGA